MGKVRAVSFLWTLLFVIFAGSLFNVESWLISKKPPKWRKREETRETSKDSVHRYQSGPIVGHVTFTPTIFVCTLIVMDKNFRYEYLCKPSNPHEIASKSEYLIKLENEVSTPHFKLNRVIFPKSAERTDSYLIMLSTGNHFPKSRDVGETKPHLISEFMTSKGARKKVVVLSESSRKENSDKYGGTDNKKIFENSVGNEARKKKIYKRQDSQAAEDNDIDEETEETETPEVTENTEMSETSEVAEITETTKTIKITEGSEKDVKIEPEADKIVKPSEASISTSNQQNSLHKLQKLFFVNADYMMGSVVREFQEEMNKQRIPEELKKIVLSKAIDGDITSVIKELQNKIHDKIMHHTMKKDIENALVKLGNNILDDLPMTNLPIKK